ncbi:MAG: porphobilinogen synthase [Gemmatimonadota bacterium]
MNAAPAVRRLRVTAALREMLREVDIRTRHLVAPLFVTDDALLASAPADLPGLARVHVDEVVAAVDRLRDLGLRGALLFGVPARRDEDGSGAWRPDGVVPRAIRAIRTAHPEFMLAADVCLCPCRLDGSCAVPGPDGPSDAATRPRIAAAAVACAQAGASLVAPSGMIDGAVGAIRSALDETGSGTVGILAYSVKHESALYGPFRDAARSTPRPGARTGLQLDPANSRDAIREVDADVAEGADIVMVKPALSNLDTLARIRARHPGVPLAAYHVSGEYAQIRAAALRGWITERDVLLEQMTALRRAGADLVVTYAAEALAGWLGA